MFKFIKSTWPLLAVIGGVTLLLIGLMGYGSQFDRSLGGPPAGSLEIPQAFSIDELDKTAHARGLILAQEDEDGGCFILTYNDGFRVLGRFSTLENQAWGSACSDTFAYTENYHHRAGVVELDRELRVVVQSLGFGDEIDITPKGGRASNPVIGPDWRVYFSFFRDGEYHPSSVQLTGEGLEFLDGIATDPVWVGGRLVESSFASRTVASDDGTLAVEQTDDLTYRVGGIGLSGEIESDKTVTLAEEIEFLSWIDTTRFLTANDDRSRLFVSTVDATTPAIASEDLIDLSKEPLFTGVGVSRPMVCRGDVYFVVSTVSDSLLVEVDADDGTLTVMGALQQSAVPLGCV